MKEIIELKGKQPGPISTILVGVHGNERCGIDAIDALLSTLQIERGTVFVCYGNPRAIEQNVRFTETNLNRMFKPDDQLSEDERISYEYGRAQYLKQYLDQSEVLLDIHASFSPVSKKFAICERNASDIVESLPVDLVVHGFDTVEPGGTDYYMNKIGKVGICIECGWLGDTAATEVAKESILSFLATRGHTDGVREHYSQEVLEMTSLYYTKTDSFKLVRQFEDFETVSAGQLIARDGDEEVRITEDGIILFASRDRDKKGDEGFLFGKVVSISEK